MVQNMRYQLARKCGAAPSPHGDVRYVPTFSSLTNPRSAANVESATILPVRGLADGTPSIDIENRATSDSTSMRCVLRVSAGSAQISSRVFSGPIPARLNAAATLTLAGKPRAPSRAEPSNTLRGPLRFFTEIWLATRY